MKKILITGGSGFIGKHLLSSLDENYDIVLLGRTINHDYKNISCDFLSDKVPLNCLENVDTVFHLAGLAHTDLDNKTANIQNKKINYEATIDLAQKAAQKKVRQFIFLSSVKAQTAFESSKRIAESDITYSEGKYGIYKKKAEEKILEISNQSNMQVKIIRSSLVYGPGVKGNLEIMKNSIINGWFPPLPEFQNKRSMIHVEDLIRALIFISKRDDTNKEIYIATDGNDYSSCEIYEIISNFVGKRIPGYRIPRTLFYLLSHTNLNIGKKIKKIISSEYYSSKKIESLGFKARYSFRDINEKII